MLTTLKTERVDDIPLLLAQLERMGVQELLDKSFPTTPVKVLFVLVILRIPAVLDFLYGDNKNQWLPNLAKIVQRNRLNLFSSWTAIIETTKTR